MRRASVLFAALFCLGCDTPTEPGPLYPGYFLTSVDGKPLPVPYGEDGTMLLAGTLGFGGLDRPRGSDPVSGTVNYTTVIRRPDQSVSQSTVQLDYAIQNDVLRINLCPPLALCLLSTELVGTIQGRTQPLVLTHYLGATAREVYTWFPALPD